ncbi:MAG: TlpA family protein disulfide reductase [Myxococcales bacterium]|jgi:peroxiredoxin|nr:TlpA family protein disulfide reductase [Myxococcales bacterium]
MKRALSSVALASTLALSSLGLAGCEGSSSAAGGGAKSPETGSAQDFTTRDVDGNTVRLSDHIGKRVVLIDFWSTYCQPCLAQFPHLNRIYAANKDKGFVVLAVSMDGPETIANVPAYAKRNSIPFPVLLDEDSRIASVYNPKKSEPLTILIDRSGKIVRTREGYNPGDEKPLEEDIVKVLAGQSL